MWWNSPFTKERWDAVLTIGEDSEHVHDLQVYGKIRSEYFLETILYVVRAVNGVI
jgi:hypothetical protein